MVLALLVALFSLIALMVIHEFGHFFIAKKFGVKVEEFGIGYPPRIFGKQFGETYYSVNLIPFGAFVKIYGEEGGVDDYRSFSNLSIWKRILVVLGGVIAFWVAAIIIFSVLFSIGASVPVGDQDVVGDAPVIVKIVEVQKDSPASRAGIRAGDMVTSLKSKTQTVAVHTISGFQKFIQENKEGNVAVMVNRGKESLTFDVTPTVLPSTNQAVVGVSLQRSATIIEKHSWYQAPIQGILFTGKVTWQSLQGIFEFFASLFKGRGVPQGSELAGPIGITIFLANAASYGLGFFLYFIGSISVLIAIFNLFPIPALDGGKLLFLIIEKVMKKPVPVPWEQGITIFFFVVLISMSLFITVKFDIPRVVNFWKTGL